MESSDYIPYLILHDRRKKNNILKIKITKEQEKVSLTPHKSLTAGYDTQGPEVLWHMDFYHKLK